MAVKAARAVSQEKNLVVFQKPPPRPGRGLTDDARDDERAWMDFKGASLRQPERSRSRNARGGPGIEPFARLVIRMKAASLSRLSTSSFGVAESREAFDLV